MNNLIKLQPKIMDIAAIHLVGMKEKTSVATMNPAEQWKQFMQRRNEVVHIPNKYFSVQEYPTDYSFQQFNPTALFEKWAAVSVNDIVEIPKGMDAMTIPAGTYAMFLHKGTMQYFPKLMQYIIGVWLPNSDYELDGRPHFEQLDERYLGPENPNSEEEIWIPIKLKTA